MNQRDPDVERPLSSGRGVDDSMSWLGMLVGVVVVLGIIFLGYTLLNSGPEGRRSSTAEAPRATTPAAPVPQTPAPPNR